MDIIINIKKCKNLIEIKKILSRLNIEELENIILILNNNYYNKTSILDDYIYDFIIGYVESYYSDSSILRNIGHKELDKKVKLPFFLGSENKFHYNDQLKNWIKKNNYPINIIMSVKADGVSILWDVKNNILYTRGDGIYGRNVSTFLPFFKPFINNIKTNIDTDKISYIRGELVAIKPHHRNIVSGQINSKIYNSDKCKNIYFYAFEIIEPRYTQENQFKLFEQYNINMVNYEIINNVNEIDTQFLSKKLLYYKKKCDFDIDGLIIRTNNLNKLNIDSNPDWSISYKLNIEFAITKILKIIWNISKHNLYIPVAHIKPVILNNTKITKASCYNARFVKDNRLGTDAIVKIIKANDIIPAINEIIKPAPDIYLPDGKWDGVNIIPLNITNTYIILKIIDFFNKLNIKSVYKNIIEKIVNLNNIKNIYDFLQFKFEPVSKQEIHLYNAINSVKKNKYYDYELLNALSLNNLSLQRCKLILKEYPDIIKNWNIHTHDLIKLHGINTILNNKIVKEINENYELITNMFSLINTEPANIISTNKKILVELSGFTNLNKYLSNEQMQYVFLTSIKNANYLVVKDINTKSNKSNYARKNNIPIITINKLIYKIKNFIKQN